MSRRRHLSGRVRAALPVAALFAAVFACDDAGKTAPERCADPPLPLFDFANAGAPSDDNARYPCVTPIGHGISYVGDDGAAAGKGGSAAAGADTGGNDAGAGGTDLGLGGADPGLGGAGGADASDAGAGGA